MPTLFAFVTPEELASKSDPARILRSAPTKSALLDDMTFDPDHPSFWARAAIVLIEKPPKQITNLRSGQATAACVCQLDT